VYVYVTAAMFVDNSNDGLVVALLVGIADIAAAIRAGTATRDLIKHAPDAPEQRELDKACQQQIPKF
jgi:hypothetical protein